MAAFLDGNLTDAEMQNVSSIIGKDDFLNGFVQESVAVEDNISALSDSHFELPENLQFKSFHLPSFNDSSDLFASLNSADAMNGMRLGDSSTDVFDDSFQDNSSVEITNKVGSTINTTGEHNSLLEIDRGDLLDDCSTPETFNENI